MRVNGGGEDILNAGSTFAAASENITRKLSLNWDPRIIGNYLELKEVSLSYRTAINEELYF